MISPVAAVVSQNFGDNPTRNLPASSWIIQTFGDYQPDGHTGTDYACEIGTAVKAVTSGRVLHEGWMPGTYADNPWWIAPNFAGICVVIDHGDFIGIYGHLSETAINKGDWVSEGQVIAKSGNTGGSTGPHLHFEVLPNGYILNSKFYGRVDPSTYLAAASLGPAGDITPVQEDTLSAAEVDTILKAIANIAAPGQTGDHYAGPLYTMAQTVESINAALLPGIAGQRHAGAVYAALTDNATVDPVELAKALVAALPADLAKAVVAELAAQLGAK